MPTFEVVESLLGLRARRVALRSGNITFVDEGEGPVVLLLHGAPFTSLAFVRVIEGLRAQHRVIAPDLPGFGRSLAASDFDGTLAAHAASIQELCEALDLRDVHLYGCDASGCTGLAAAARMPERITGLVVADTVPIPMSGAAWIIKMMLRHVVTSRVVRWLNRKLNLFAWLVASVDPIRRRFAASVRRVLVAQYDTEAKRERILDLFAAMGHDDAFMRRTEAEVSRALADKPVLLLFGQFDPVRCVGAVGRFRRMFRRSTTTIIPWERHFPLLAAGEQVAAAIAAFIRTP